MKIYVINLARNTERLKIMEQQLNGLGLSFERFDACDGYAIPETERKAAELARPLGVWNSPGHIGCLFSHWHLWEKIADDVDDCACIMEDDVHVAAAFAKLLKAERSFPKDFDLIRLECSPSRVWLGKRPIYKDAETGIGLHKLRSSSYGAAAYIISRSCAKTMAMLPTNKHQATDFLLFDFKKSPEAKIFATYQFSPAVIVQDKNLGAGNRKFGFTSELNDGAPPRAPMGTWAALKKGRFSYIWKTLRGYRLLDFVT